MMAWLLVILVAAAAVQTPAAAQTTPAGSAEAGRRLFTTDYCYACHGTQGQGGKDGARIAPNPSAFATFRAYVRKPSGLMPAYSSTILTEQELADIYAFLKSIHASKPAKSIPLLNR